MERKKSTMTDREFDVLDELYFLTSFQELSENCGLSREALSLVLWELMKKNCANCYRKYDQEFKPTKEEFEANFADYHYLASKKGLMAHNAR